MPTTLGIETSCDDCSVSVVRDNGEVLFLNQDQQDQIHQKFGGVVPELASRQHENQLLPLIEQALKQIPLSSIDLIAVTNRPGLLGALLVGCVTAKSLSLCWNKPLVGVNHIEAHIFSPLLFKKGRRKKKLKIQFPALAFVVSGGHTCLFRVNGIGQSLLIAKTRDDSAGEAFDKFARLMGLKWPGGPLIDSLAQRNKKKEKFFSKIKTNDLSFSFSGIKSQGQRLLANSSKKNIEKIKLSLCDSYQTTIVDHLMDKLNMAFEQKAVKQVLVGGGVSANSFFRNQLKQWSDMKSVPCLFPEKSFCTDNGAMIAWLGGQYFLNGEKDNLKMPCAPTALKKDFFKIHKL